NTSWMRRVPLSARASVGEEMIPCDDVILAIGQENAFEWIERDAGLEFGKWDMPVVDEMTFQSTVPNVFFGGDAALDPRILFGRSSTAIRRQSRSISSARNGW
ncbi:MAG: FAD-dependent oxidoreductase, partial [Robiginitomaculum sp.]|nr:FAD-dependent oxidoreductase [Robiginitomaculum sp.]